MIQEALALWQSSALTHSLAMACQSRWARALRHWWAQACTPRSGEMVGWALSLAVFWIGGRHSADTGWLLPSNSVQWCLGGQWGDSNLTRSRTGSLVQRCQTLLNQRAAWTQPHTPTGKGLYGLGWWTWQCKTLSRECLPLSKPHTFYVDFIVSRHSLALLHFYLYMINTVALNAHTLCLCNVCNNIQECKWAWLRVCMWPSPSSQYD